MTMKNKAVAVAAMCGILGVAAVALAADTTNTAPNAARPATADKWWNHSSLKDNPVPPEFRYHFEGSYSRGETTGNDESTTDSGSAKLVLRKNIVSSLSTFSIYKSEQTMAVGTTSTTYKDKESAHQAFIVDMTPRLSFQSGARWYTDRARYIDARYNYYGGLQYRILDTDTYQFICGLFAGYDETTYRNDLLQLLVPGVSIDPYKGGAYFGTESFRWQVTDGLALTEEGEYLSWFNSDGYYRWNVSVGADFKLLANLSWVASYKVGREFDAFVETAIPYGYEQTDTSLTTGLKVSF